jgi:putative drug exporter of the RND superfamily
VPAVMHWLGRANWWLPKSWDRKLPQLHVEGRPEVYLAGSTGQGPGREMAGVRP